MDRVIQGMTHKTLKKVGRIVVISAIISSVIVSGVGPLAPISPTENAEAASAETVIVVGGANTTAIKQDGSIMWRDSNASHSVDVGPNGYIYTAKDSGNMVIRKYNQDGKVLEVRGIPDPAQYFGIGKPKLSVSKDGKYVVFHAFDYTQGALYSLHTSNLSTNVRNLDGGAVWNGLSESDKVQEMYILKDYDSGDATNIQKWHPSNLSREYNVQISGTYRDEMQARVRVGPNTDYLYATASNRINKRNIDDGTYVWDNSLSSTSPHGLAVDPDNNYVYASKNSEIEQFQVSDGTLYNTLTPGISGNIEELEFSPTDSNKLYMVTDAGEIGYITEPNFGDYTEIHTQGWSRSVDFFTYTPPPTISGNVHNSSNAGIENATVEVINDSTNNVAYTTETDSNGDYSVTVTSGTYDVRASKDAYSSSRKGPYTIDSDTTVNFEINQIASQVEGYVTNNRTGDPIEGVNITHSAVNFDANYTVYTDSLGYYNDTVYTGYYNITVQKTGYVNKSFTNIDLTNNKLRDYELAKKNQYIVSGTITDIDGNALDSATVEAGGKSVSTDSNGKYEMIIDGGTYDFTADALNYNSKTKTVSISSDTYLDFSLEEQRLGETLFVLDGTVANDKGQSLGGVSVLINGSEKDSTDSNGYYSITLENGTYNVTYAKDLYKNEYYEDTFIQQNKTIDITLNPTRSLELNVPNLLKPNETVDYTVYYNVPAYDTHKNVNDQATVISNNSSIISVDSTNFELNAKSITAQTWVNASYGGYAVNKRITVAEIKLENIAILPSEYWVQAAMGWDEDQAEWGMGSEIQWIFLAILLGGFVAWKMRNEYTGLGVITMLIILFWVIGYVSLGPVLAGVFYAIFAGYQLRETPGRSDTNVGNIQ